jgi:hypothetical protein
MGAHALGAAAYAAKTAGSAAAAPAGDDEIAWQLSHMSADVRAALARLPPLGTDPAGPLGTGLLSSGELGATIRSIQAAIAT